MIIATVVGARPQFIKSAPVSTALRNAGIEELVIHTGQHYDRAMSGVFFEEMGIAEPYANLGVGSGLHGWQTARMLEAIEKAFLDVKPDWVLVYGDTNSTLAAALAASKLRIPLAHVESGLRSYNRDMPEEHNRVLTDHCSDMLFCPTETAVRNLAMEGITQGVLRVGDTMFDAVLRFRALAQARSGILSRLGLEAGEYHLATLHRPYNTDDPTRLAAILQGLAGIQEKVVFPVHPRTRKCLTEILADHSMQKSLVLTEPVGYLDMLMLESNARTIITDSGGVQKEAFFFSIPCVTVRSETEWIETVECGWNILVDADAGQIISAVERRQRPDASPPPFFGDGQASVRIVEALASRSLSFSGETFGCLPATRGVPVQ